MFGYRDMRHRSFLLELASKENFLPKAFPESGIFVVRAGASEAELCRHLWVAVGRGFWNEREDWALEQWHTYLSNEAISFWIAKKDTEELEGGRTFCQNSQALLFFAEYISQERYN